jgi:hypothetical protein
MNNFAVLTGMHSYQRISYKGKMIRAAVRACDRIQKASEHYFFKTQYPDCTTLVITRVPTKCEATRDQRAGKVMVRQWPFVMMLPNHPETFTDDAAAAVRRVRSMKHSHPDLFFKIERPDRNTAVITKVETAAEATHQSLNKSWPFKDMVLGQSVEFDVTFFSTEDRQKLSVAAHGNYLTYQKRFSTRTRNTASGQRIITVTRIS